MKTYLLDQLLQEKRDNIIKIAAQHGAFNIHIFGSVARGEETEDSDIKDSKKQERSLILMLSQFKHYHENGKKSVNNVKKTVNNGKKIVKGYISF